MFMTVKPKGKLKGKIEVRRLNESWATPALCLFRLKYLLIIKYISVCPEDPAGSSSV